MSGNDRTVFPAFRMIRERGPGNYSNKILACRSPACYLLCMTPREAELSAALAASQRENAQLRQELELLKQKIDALVRRVFGSKSEQLNPAQLELLLTGLEDPPPLPGKSDASRVASTAGDTLEASPADHTLRPAKPARRPRLPEHLPVIEEVIDPAIVKADPQAWRCIGQEVTEQLDYTPGRFLRRHLIRRSRPQGDSQPFFIKHLCWQIRQEVPAGSLARHPPPHHTAGRLPRGPRPACRHHRRQILRPPAALPAGADF